MNDEKLLSLLKEKVKETSISCVALELGITRSFLSRVLNGHVPLTPRLREYMGYRRVCKLEKISNEAPTS